MLPTSVIRLLPAFLLITSALSAEKQIKLEDIEKDNLKADQQAKLEKQYQQYQQYQEYQQQPALQYQYPSSQSNYPQNALAYHQSALAYQQPAVSYQPQQQTPSPYAQYVLPYSPQYLQPSLYQGNYPQINSNSIASGYQTSTPPHPFQNYFSQQLQPVAVPGQAAASSQPGLVMAYSSPSIAAFQQQAASYYQNLPAHLQQYIPSQSAQVAPFFYQQQPGTTSAPSTEAPAGSQSGSVYYSPQSYASPYQAISNTRIPSNGFPAASPQYSQPPAVPSTYLQSVTPSPYSSSQTYSQTEIPPSFISSLKSSPQSAASFGQQQQYLQSIGSTITPLQSKYLNSPQYLSQNYNTISSSQLIPKSTYSGAKPTSSPTLKVAAQGGFVPTNPSSSHYQAYRSISG